jgi:hypothetical protein
MESAMTSPTGKFEVDFKDRAFDAALADAARIYEVNGCFLAKGLFSEGELDPIREDIARLIGAQTSSVGLPLEKTVAANAAFDDGIVELARHDRRAVGRIFDACRRLLPVHQVSVDERLISISKHLMDTELVAASDIKAVRIDLPEESKYLFDWHQDYPYVMDSLDAVVFWIPLHDVDETNGALWIAPGTHKLGLQRLALDDPDNAANNKQKMMHIADLSFMDRFDKVRVPVAYGDVLVFSTLALHASGPNSSNKARFTLQVRFGNFLDSNAIEKGWPGSMRDGSVFHKLHPEFIVPSLSDRHEKGLP